MNRPNTGDTLKNGATVLESRKDIVLAFVKGALQPFVIWSLDNENNAYWGHYFKDMNKASKVFNNMAKG